MFVFELAHLLNVAQDIGETIRFRWCIVQSRVLSRRICAARYSIVLDICRRPEPRSMYALRLSELSYF